MTKKLRTLDSNRVNDAMRIFEAQAVLFSARPSRFSVVGLNLPRVDGAGVTINVWRNHNFEFMESLVEPYFAIRGLAINFRISAYDDSLSFSEYSKASAELIWLDIRRFLERLDFEEWLVWLRDRIGALRGLSTAPIIIATWLENGEHQQSLQAIIDTFPAVYFAELSSVCLAAGIPLIDNRSAAFAGTPLSNAAQLELARELACHWLPGVLLPPVKAVALDLDCTLHAGILGEDGIQGVRLTNGHIALQKFAKALRLRGIFLALVSRNERSDVEALFKQRHDYPLRWEDFSVIEVSWEDKAIALERIAKALRIASDSVLFVDDNPGELARVLQQLPQIQAIHAHEDAELTCRAINYYPGLWRWRVEHEDAKRIFDLHANSERERLAERFKDSSEYFSSLQVALRFNQNPSKQLSRLTDLCNKTNQFNLAMRRLNEVELAELMDRPDASVVSVELSDRLSDSGVIAVLVAERSGRSLMVLELCISCRAMGRSLEDNIILTALCQMSIFAGCEEVIFLVKHAPRNQPALNWLSQLLGAEGLPLPGLHAISADRLKCFVPADGVTLIQS